MPRATLAIRMIFGLIFVNFGFSYFFVFLPTQPAPQGGAGEHISALLKIGYFFPFLYVCEILCGVALVTGFFVPLDLIIIAHTVVHKNLFHIFLTPHLGLGLTLLFMNLFLG